MSLFIENHLLSLAQYLNFECRCCIESIFRLHILRATTLRALYCRDYRYSIDSVAAKPMSYGLSVWVLSSLGLDCPLPSGRIGQGRPTCRRLANPGAPSPIAVDPLTGPIGCILLQMAPSLSKLYRGPRDITFLGAPHRRALPLSRYLALVWALLLRKVRRDLGGVWYCG